MQFPQSAQERSQLPEGIGGSGLDVEPTTDLNAAAVS
jgi:hypothetical protein